MNNSYTIKANIGVDQYLNVNLKQDVDIYEILSLELSQENLYKFHSADYGVIVGRVLANDAFGIPNAKVSVFIPLSDTDKLNQYIRTVYPYNFVNDEDSRNVKYNLLPNYKEFECHQEVGSFPKKQLVLDNDSVLEIYDKYYKYTTVTNNAGDYMIFGVPTGEQMLHVDVDLSDIGILSQEPRDFIYKGYSPDLFESPTQFKKSTNLDDLPQLFNQSTSVTVYPLWGDKDSNEIAITRKDITLEYKFETTCVFLGSIITDNGSSYISHECVPDTNIGEAGQLTVSKGNIEMIRKTVDGTVEEYTIKGNQLIDSDGVWCYQIPMNLDYVGTDEKGNIVPTNDVSKGIPTRTRVRFRITLDEGNDYSLSSHKARYLVPNNPDVCSSHVRPKVSESAFDNFYEFGTNTPDDCFRDLYWNKVYSVKNYIPRIQKSSHENITNYLAIKGVNKKNAKKNNLLPYNKLNLNMSIPFSYFLNKYVYDLTHPDESEDGFNFKGIIDNFWNLLKSVSHNPNFDSEVEEITEEQDGISLDFYNDWLNGCLYFPSWYLHSEKNGEKSFCNCKNTQSKDLYVFNSNSLVYGYSPDEGENADENGYNLRIYEDLAFADNIDLYDYYKSVYTTMPFGSKKMLGGVIKSKTTKNNDEVFYYSFGNKLNDNVDEFFCCDYARLFSTDIILLGSLKDFDIDGVPKVMHNLPVTTSNIPSMGRYKPDEYASGGTSEYTFNGMNWGHGWYDENGNIVWPDYGEYNYKFDSGLFFGLRYSKMRMLVPPFFIKTVTCIIPRSEIKSIVNAERLCELGVNLESNIHLTYYGLSGEKKMDGLITKKEISDTNSRSLFATLNQNKLNGTIVNEKTGYKKYNIEYLYPTNFDGRLEEIANDFTSGDTKDYRNKDYLDFRFGSNAINGNELSKQRHFYGYKKEDDLYFFGGEPSDSIGYTYAFPLYNNSFYFYFGLNQGSTAIEKFNEQFMSKCKKE